MKHIIFFFLFICTACIACFGLFSPDNDVHIIQCDVGQGDSTLIISGYSQILVDTGPDDSVLKCLDTFMPPWDRYIDLIIGTHADLDHIGGMESILERYAVERFVFNQLDSESQTVKSLERALSATSTPIQTTSMGKIITVSTQKEDVRFKTLWPEENCVNVRKKNDVKTKTNYTQIKSAILECPYDDNESSISGILEVRGVKILHTGDINMGVELAMLSHNVLIDVDIIKVSHHGAKTSTSESFIDFYKPEVALIGVGKNNQFEHPTPRVIDLLRSRNIRTFRTDRDGHIEIKPGAAGLTIRTYR